MADRAEREDPYAVLRVLPVGVEHVWLSRAASALVFAVIAVAAQSRGGPRPLSPEALQYLLVWIGGATLMITLLGVNYGITLFPGTTSRSVSTPSGSASASPRA